MENKHMEQMAREHEIAPIDAQTAKEVAEAVSEGAVSGYKKIHKKNRGYSNSLYSYIYTTPCVIQTS